MIKANELRIGNWVHAFKTEWSIQGDDFKYEEMPYDPIPLTREIIESCGFEKHTLGYNSLNSNINLYQMKEGLPILPCWKENVIGKEIKYLHQLQNLYFALTQTEIEFDYEGYNGR